jgi:hypothetical protein
MLKDLLPKQVVCNEKDHKGKPCHGKIKRYYPFADYFNEPDDQLREAIRQEFGENPKLVLLKCEECRTLYRLPEVLKRRFKQS